jgi:hypothetical protein
MLSQHLTSFSISRAAPIFKNTILEGDSWGLSALRHYLTDAVSRIFQTEFHTTSDSTKGGEIAAQLLASEDGLCSTG